MSPRVNWLTGMPKLAGNGWPWRRVSSGLGSKRSTWLGPPTMNMKITEAGPGSAVVPQPAGCWRLGRVGRRSRGGPEPANRTAPVRKAATRAAQKIAAGLDGWQVGYSKGVLWFHNWL